MNPKANIDSFTEEVFSENIDCIEKNKETSSSENKTFETVKEFDTLNEGKVDTSSFSEEVDSFTEEVFSENIDCIEKNKETSSSENKTFETVKELDTLNEGKVDTSSFSETVDEVDLDISEENIEYIHPFSEDIDEIIDESEFEDQEYVKNEPNSIVFFQSKKYFLLLFSLFIIIFIINEVKNLVENMINGSILDGFYLIVVLMMLIYVYKKGKSIYETMSKLKNVTYIKNTLLKKEHSKEELYSIYKHLIENYEDVPYKSKELNIELKNLKTKINNPNKSILSEYLYNDFGRHLDKKAKKIIADASVSTGITTAISPIPIFDMMIVLIRTYALSKDIALLYGYQPSPLVRLFLLRKAIRNIAFAGVSEMVIDMGVEGFANTILSKSFSRLSASFAQGVANGMLMVRLGINIADECRPSPRKIERKEINNDVYNYIYKKIKNNFKN